MTIELTYDESGLHVTADDEQVLHVPSGMVCPRCGETAPYIVALPGSELRLVSAYMLLTCTHVFPIPGWRLVARGTDYSLEEDDQ